MNERHITAGFATVADARRVLHHVQTPFGKLDRVVWLEAVETAVAHRDIRLIEQAAAKLRESCELRRAGKATEGN